MRRYWSVLPGFFKLFGARNFCPVCQKRNSGFNPLPDFYRLNAERYGYTHFGKGETTALDTYSCHSCGASDRERLYAWWLSQAFFMKPAFQERKAIHFAPESGLSNFIKRQNFFSDYQTADFMMQGMDHKLDLMNLPFPGGTYDFFICSHVLEHVADDGQAIAELYRVTKKGGSGILMAPIITNLANTIEDPSITDEGERWRLFGQNDHVRLYARNDYVARILKAGFNLQQYGMSYFGSGLFKKLGLKPTSVLYIVTKP
ncbi:MAG: class I SAM-dependent methyltransferase [Pseudomonadota bacterium]